MGGGGKSKPLICLFNPSSFNIGQNEKKSQLKFVL